MNNLKKIRVDRGMSQAVLAEKMGVAQNTISNWEKGIRDIDSATLQKLAVVLDVTIDYILGRTDTPLAYDVIAEGEATQLNDIYFRLGKEAQQLNVPKEDIDLVLEMWKLHSKRNNKKG